MHPLRVLQDVLSGRLFSKVFLIKYRWYVLFLFGVALMYMATHYYMEKTEKEMKKERLKLVELREKYTRRFINQESLIKQSTIIRAIKEREIDIKAPKEPPKKIKIN